ncbi:MAG: hypothetical protein R2875_15755 [Desulfobacterales bacterium]
MGWFDDVRVAVEPSAQGNTVIFTVQEKPTIREIRFSGNVAVDDDTLKENGHQFRVHSQYFYCPQKHEDQ